VIWEDDSVTNIAQQLITNRGFTGHEHIEEVGLIHMNGRVYDQELGRFLSADPFVQSPFMTNSFNRYSYVMNNPLKYTDPTGFFVHENGGKNYNERMADIKDNKSNNGKSDSKSKKSKFSQFLDKIAEFSNKVADALKDYSEENLERNTASLLIARQAYNGDVPPDLLRNAQNTLGVTDEKMEQIGKIALAAGAIIGSRIVAKTGVINDNIIKNKSLCFVVGTKVQTPDGEKNIEDIKTGDFVYSFDGEAGEVVIRKVTDTYHNWTKNLVDIVVDGETISSTPSHKFWLPELQKWVIAEEIKEGTKLLQKDGSFSIVQSVSSREGLIDVYNLEVTEEHNYFVGNVGYLVHNGSGEQSFADYNKARNAALGWLNERGFKAEAQTIGKFGDNAGKPIGMQTIDGKTGFRIEFDRRSGAHINVWSGKEKGPHIKFEGDQKHVNNLVQRFMCK